MVTVTKHAKQRIRQRCGVNDALRISKIAYERGLKHSDLTGNLKKWVDGLWFRNKTANQIRLYGDKAYIFRDATLITVLQIPHNLVKDADRARKEKENGHG